MPMDDLPPQAARNALRWDVETLWLQLGTVLPGLSIEVLAQVESTNTVLIERARKLAGRLDAPISTPGELDRIRGSADRERERAGDRGPYGRRAVDTHPSLLVAEHQTLGRGRMGRDWLSQPGRSLTMSLGLPMQPHHWGGLSLAVGVALADALDPLAGPNSQPRIGLKWPNDLWLIDAAAANGVGRKLGGILIETVPVGALRMVVVGVGLNVLPRTEDEANTPSNQPFASGFASLSEIDPEAGAPATLHRITRTLIHALQSFEVAGLEPVMASFARRDVLAGRRVTVLRPPPVAGAAPAPAEATAIGISDRGTLLVRELAQSGAMHAPVTEVTSGEVSIRIDARPPGGSGRWLED
jgi:BirA family transcriptional regulator, biotin operon repressor / biotin---[acetyl-CoA-carboxylase] ligase